MKLSNNVNLIIGVCPLFLGEGIFRVASPAFLMSIGVDITALGNSSFVGYLLAVLFAPFFGRLGRRFSNRNAAFWSIVIYGIGVFGIVVFKNVMSYNFCSALLRFVPTCAGVCSYAYLIKMAESDVQRSRSMVALATLSTSFGTFGYLLGGVLTDISPILAFVVEGGMLVLLPLIMLTAKKDESNMTAIGSVVTILKEENPIVAFARCIKGAKKGLPLFFLMLALISLGYIGFNQSYDYYLQEGLGLSASASGMIRFVIGVAAIITNFTIVNMWIVKKFNGARTITVTALVCAAASLIAVVNGNVAFICAGTILFIVINVTIGVQQKIMGDLATPETSELVSANYNSVDNLAAGFSALIAAYVYSMNASYSFILAAVSFVLAAVVARGLYQIMVKSGNVQQQTQELQKEGGND